MTAIAILACAIAVVIGWNLSMMRMAHKSIITRRGQLGPLRRDRTHHLVMIGWALALAAGLVVLVVAAGVR